MKLWKRLLQNLQPATPPPERPQVKDPFDLDNPLLRLSPVDAWSIRDSCEGVQIFGAIGSGKTSGSGDAIAKAFLRQGFGGLVMCAKPEERRDWERRCAETGRSKHLVVFSPSEKWRFNFLDYELRRSGSGAGLTENLVNLLTSITEIVEGKQGMSGGDPFWDRAMKELLRNTVDLLTLSYGRLSLEDICNLIADAPTAAQLGDKKWRSTSFCAECIAVAKNKEKNRRQTHDFDMATKFFLQSFATLDSRPRTSIISTFTSIADVLNHGLAWELLSTETNLVPEVTYKDGAIILLDLPIQEYNELGRIVQGIFKYMFQRAILRRDVSLEARPVFLWADEAQNFISSFDYQAQAVARSARLCTVYLTQNISNYYAVLGAGGRDEANALLGNFQTKIFHANGDQPTNQYASDIIAQEWTTTHNYGTSQSDESSSRSGGGSESVQSKVLPGEFTVLRKGGPANNLEVDGIIFQGGRIWNATGDTYLKTIFKQG